MYILIVVISNLLINSYGADSKSFQKQGDTAKNQPKPIKNLKVLLVSLDGFRWDYPKKTSTPNIDRITKNGASAKRVHNVFPTLTLPNHQSIVTGLYPENHGFVGNSFYDNRYKEVFDLEKNFEAKWWNSSVPIWIENQLQGHESGNLYWPGFNSLIKGMKAKYLPPNSFAIPYIEQKNLMQPKLRIKTVVEWLKKPNVTFVAMYYDKVDYCSHENGPDHNKEDIQMKHMRECIGNADKFVGDLMNSLSVNSLDEKTDVIFVGDHGHASLKKQKVIFLDKYFDTKKYCDLITGYTHVFIYPKFGYKDYIYNTLKHASDHFKVYKKEDIPEKLHIKHNYRTGDILVLGEPGWVIANEKNKPWFINKPNDWTIGDHGFSSFEQKMNPIFFAIGPSFKKGYRKEIIQTVDLYSLMCHLLKIKPRANDGKLDRLKDLLKA